MKKLIAVFLCLALLCLSVTAICEEDLIGIWKPQKFVVNGNQAVNQAVNDIVGPISKSSIYEFTDEGRIRITQTETLHYALTDNSLVLIRGEMSADDMALMDDDEAYTYEYKLYDGVFVLIQDLGYATVYQPYVRAEGTDGLIGKWNAVFPLSEESFQDYLKNPEYYESLTQEFSVKSFLVFNEDGTCVQSATHELLSYAIDGEKLVWKQDMFGRVETQDFAYRFEDGWLVLCYEDSYDVIRMEGEEIKYEPVTDQVEAYLERVSED